MTAFYKEAMSANMLSLLLWLGSCALNAVFFAILSSRQRTKEILKRVGAVEKSNKRIQGWIFGKFGADLNGDD